MINLTHLVLLVQHFSWEDSSLGRLAARRVVDLEAENLGSDVSSLVKFDFSDLCHFISISFLDCTYLNSRGGSPLHLISI